MPYVVVYDPLYSLAFVWPLLIFLLVALIALACAWNPFRLGGKRTEMPLPARILIAILPAALFVGITISVTTDWYRQKRHFEASEFTLTEGAVHGFTPEGDHRPARFDLDGIPFSYHGTLGRPIREGTRLRISHRADVILRVEALRNRVE